MALFWIVHEIDGKKVVWIQDAGDKIFARMKAGLAGLTGDFAEIHGLDEKTARKVPKAMTGRALSQREAKALLEKIG